MEIREDLRYTESDEWLRVEGEEGVVGITDYAQEQLSDIVYVEVTVGEGDELEAGEEIAEVESVKAAAYVYMPVGGRVVAVNGELAERPEVINADPYGEAWMVKVALADRSQVEGLMDAGAYERHCEEREQ